MWSVPPIWAGRTVAILAGGESMTAESAELVRRAGIPAIAVNDTVLLAPWASMLYAADVIWWTAHPEAAVRKAQKLFAGLKVGATLTPVKDVLHLRVSYGPPPEPLAGFDPDPSAVRTGGNSGYQALHVAAHARAARVLLLGIDMRGAEHWHGKHQMPLRNTPPEQYVRWAHRFALVAPTYAAMGIEVINCSAISALQCFRRLSLEDALAESLERPAA